MEKDIINWEWNDFYFHLFMLFLSIYQSMLFSNWTVIEFDIQTNTTFAWSSFYIKGSIMIITNIIYFYVLLNPRYKKNDDNQVNSLINE